MVFRRVFNFLNVLLFATSLSLPVQRSNYYKILKSVDVRSDPFSKQDKVDSLLDCIVKCPLITGCLAVTYSEVENVCLFYDWGGVSLRTGIPTKSMVVNMGISMFHATGSDLLTFNQAAGLCQQLGGVLASVSDLYDARDSGYDLCRCGWVSDESIRFVIQYERPDCDSYSTGVISCKQMTSSTDAYCKFH